MIARPTAAIGSFLFLAGGLLLTIAAPVKSAYWIGEVSGVSMIPTLRGERTSFNCCECHNRLYFDREIANQKSVLRCDHCGELQIIPQNAIRIAADRVVIGPAPHNCAIALQTIVAINHPKFGLTIKRVAGTVGDKYFVIGDSKEESTDSRDSQFGLVNRDQIRGIVVKILPTIPLAAAKRSR